MLAWAEAVRGFNRFYTRQIGLLDKSYLQSGFSLTEVRILYELAHRHGPTATDLARELHLDTGYLSRLLEGFVRRGLIERRSSPSDGRQSHLLLTAKGRQTFSPLEAKSNQEIAAMLDKLSAPDRDRLIQAMRTIQRVLGGEKDTSPCVLREHRPGDIGWIIHRHGVLYAREYSYNETFEALVAEIAAKFIRQLDRRRERCWIAERNGEILGCVFLVKHTALIAKLRLLLVEPSARGLGLGTRLVDECIRFARQAGYKKIVLWTQRELKPARRIYKRAGFRCVAHESSREVGRDSIAETWELAL